MLLITALNKVRAGGTAYAVLVADPNAAHSLEFPVKDISKYLERRTTCFGNQHQSGKTIQGWRPNPSKLGQFKVTDFIYPVQCFETVQKLNNSCLLHANTGWKTVPRAALSLFPNDFSSLENYNPSSDMIIHVGNILTLHNQFNSEWDPLSRGFWELQSCEGQPGTSKWECIFSTRHKLLRFLFSYNSIIKTVCLCCVYIHLRWVETLWEEGKGFCSDWGPVLSNFLVLM